MIHIQIEGVTINLYYMLIKFITFVLYAQNFH